MKKRIINDLIAKYNEKEELYEVYKDNEFVGYLNDPLAIEEIMVKDLINQEENYFIPDFQRGYRWDKSQVLDLLNDINDWNVSHGNLERYCLQPIVFKKVDGYYHVIDGQQRLTTLYIILKAIDKPPKYKLEYKTREGSATFLEELSEEKSLLNIDYYYMYQAHKTVNEFFENKKNSKDVWFDKLINELTGAFFIKYEVFDQDEREVEEIFNNLNAGKVPLTDSELIKAYILSNIKADNKNNKELEVSFEWDRIERKLQDDNFWAWLGQKDLSGPRINYLFKLEANLLKVENLRPRQARNYKFQEDISSYRTLAESIKLNDNNGIEIFQKAKETFMKIEDWYDDKETYHLIGFFNNAVKRNKNEVVIFNLLKLFRQNKQINLRENIKSFILADNVNKPNSKKINYDKYNYQDNADDTYNLLFLFNIITSINSKEQFNFAAYSKTLGKLNKRYQIEHIFPQTDIDLSKEEIKKLICYIKETIKELNLDEDNQSLEEIIRNLDEDNFNVEYKKIVAYDVEEKVQEINGIGNLCLLDGSTNSSFKNHPFIFKLHKIIEETQKDNNYILPATKNVFLKYYSNFNVNNLTWSRSDETAYTDKIKNTINEFLNIKR